MTQPTNAAEPSAAEEIAFELAEDGTGGEGFVLRVFPDPSGLRGQVFRGEEKIAGVQIYHSTDRDLLLREARRNRAVLRAAAAT